MPRSGGAPVPAGAPSRCRDLRDDAGAGPRRALHAELPAERLDAIGETAQARPSAGVGAACAVVDDLHHQSVLVELHLDPHERCARVLCDIRERLGADEVRGRLDGGGEAPGVHAHPDRDRRAAGKLSERRGQAAGRQR